MLELIKKFYKKSKSYSPKEYANELLRNLTPRMRVSKQLSDAFNKASDANNLQAMTEISEVQSGVVDVMIERNIEAIKLEKAGEDEKAVGLYEMNVKDQFDGSHPYERLIIYYKSKNSPKDVIRIADAYLRYGTSGNKTLRDKCQLIVNEQCKYGSVGLLKIPD